MTCLPPESCFKPPMINPPTSNLSKLQWSRKPRKFQTHDSPWEELQLSPPPLSPELSSPPKTAPPPLPSSNTGFSRRLYTEPPPAPLLNPLAGGGTLRLSILSPAVQLKPCLFPSLELCSPLPPPPRFPKRC